MLLVRIFILATLLATAAFPQGERASVTGTVTDSSGAILVGAPVSIRNVATNITTSTTTNASGIYYLTSLNPGRYELRVNQTGFRPAVVNDLTLGAGLNATLDVKLEVGAVTEAVQVSATAVQLEAQSTALGKVMTTSQVAGMPLIGRNVLNLVGLAAGVTPVAW